MLRALALLLLGLLLLVGGSRLEPMGEAAADAPGLAAEQARGDDCCPPRPGDGEGEGDCCDLDLGRCCATGLVALAPDPPQIRSRRPVAAQDRAQLPPDLLRPRTTGPPPTPPPIG